MCELFGMSARHPASVSFSLRRFAARGGLAGKTLDGWGIALFDGRDIRICREPEPAQDSPWVSFIEARHRPSNIVISHIRHATLGAVCLANTQPFARESAGRMHAFAHNGKLADTSGLDRDARRFRPLGETDSELAACALFQGVGDLWGSGIPSPSERLALISDFATRLRLLGPANFLYSDGELLVAHGHRRTQASSRIEPPGLWMLERKCPHPEEALEKAGVRIEDDQLEQSVVVFASVPLTDEPWRALDEGQVVAVSNGSIITST
ncbi:MAG: class II glutamine amidotransferase [Gammaproteobacteria bacterium]|nr:class II glutamine amidotransferase [Gammaproteobacteria bacterium]